MNSAIAWRIRRSMRPVRVFDGQDDQATDTALKVAYESLPAPRVTTDAPLAAGVAAAWSASPNNDGVDRISSSLPTTSLAERRLRLPAKDAVHTGKLARRWRGI
ncbi:hypothetical protein PR202_ga16957 [Eleusine coracana subsp. coracana]|uniref:Uncharacterized protein n=1 Tax=Eleusine coracana subsp. coracana TaxID=191504 RepID=A0AAV5CNX5_ELECO|nr:hypothetical protein PR202_ga16957 [Eleusine coracana subsp. coracana]